MTTISARTENKATQKQIIVRGVLEEMDRYLVSIATSTLTNILSMQPMILTGMTCGNLNLLPTIDQKTHLTIVHVDKWIQER